NALPDCVPSKHIRGVVGPKRYGVRPIGPLTLNGELDRLHVGLTEQLGAHDIGARAREPSLFREPPAGIEPNAHEHLRGERAVGMSWLHRIVEGRVRVYLISEIVAPDMSDRRRPAADAEYNRRVPRDEMPEITWYLAEDRSQARRLRTRGLRRRRMAREDRQGEECGGQ